MNFIEELLHYLFPHNNTSICRTCEFVDAIGNHSPCYECRDNDKFEQRKDGGKMNEPL